VAEAERHPVFDLFVSGIQAYNQVVMFVAALICLGIGGLILGNSLYWRVHALRASGTVIGVIASGNTYAPVYRYTLPDGQTHVAKSDTASGWLRGKETGRVVPLMISAHNPNEARERRSYLAECMACVFLVPGLWLAYIAVTAFPVTPMTWIMGISLIGYGAVKLHGIIIPKGQRLSIEEWRKSRHLGEPVDLSLVKPAESFSDGFSRAAQWHTNKYTLPFVALFALLLTGLGIYESVSILRLETSGLRAEGVVVRLDAEESDNSYTYYPVVRARLPDGSSLEFKDSIGSNPSSYRVNDKVRVLYLPASPHRPIIDRGLWNGLIPLLLLAGGAFLIWISAALLRDRRTAATDPTSPGPVKPASFGLR
jgi:uncharacterized protein DUF3592